MIQQSYEVIVQKIVESTKLSKEEIETKIQEKLTELHELVSKEGAAHIVANSFNVNLFESVPQQSRVLKVRDLRPGLNGIEIHGRMISRYEPRTFQKNGRAGRVLSIMIGDETGTVRTAIWDDKLIQEVMQAKEGDVFKLKNGYVKENNERVEFHLGNKAQITINPGETQAIKKTGEMRRKQLVDVKENEYVETLGFVVQVFEPKYYAACPVCNKKVILQDNVANCPEHKQVTPKQTPILNLVLDDSTSTIRVVCFRDVAQKLLAEQTTIEGIKQQILGKPLLIKGKITQNQMMGRIELVANSVEEPDAAALLAELP